MLPAPPSTSKFHKVLRGLKIVRSSGPGITHRCRARWRSAGRVPKCPSAVTEAAGRRWSLSPVLRSCCGRHPRSDPGLIEAAEQPSASEGGVASSLHCREKRPMATRGRRSLEAALANHRRGIGKSNRSELLIGWPAARGLSFFPETSECFCWSLERGRCKVSPWNAIV